MMKHIGTAITFLILPAILFAIIYFGMTFFADTIEVPPEPTEQHMLSPKEPSTTCGNAICEKIERDKQNCAEDC